MAQGKTVPEVRVNVGGRTATTHDILAYDRDLAPRLHPLDRVHTYGSFHIADIRP